MRRRKAANARLHVRVGRGIALVCLGAMIEGSSGKESGAQRQQETTVNPPGVSFVLRTKDAKRRQFHLGEMIEIEEDYSASVADRYSLLQNPEHVGGKGPSLSIDPSDGVVNRMKETGWVSARAILDARCEGLGFGGGVGNFCADCNGVYTLGVEPVRFPYALNYRFTITRPGHYRMQVKAANVVLAGQTDKPLEVVSTPLEIDVVKDEMWSQETLKLTLERFEAAQTKYREQQASKSSELGTEAEQEIVESAQIMRFLDTEESLQQAVRLYDGSPRLATYESPFQKAILESSHRDLAVSLLAKRLTDEDFLASREFVDLLTAMTIQTEEPEVFARSDAGSMAQLNPRTVQILREYVLALGRSLPAKNAAARREGTATFETYAAHEYCGYGPLVDKRTATEIRQAAKAE